jgi:ADP-heptose:LPS heptosyltransferase
MKFENKKNVLLLIPLSIIIGFCHFINFFRKNNNHNKVILLIDLGHFGDQLMLTPAIKYLRNHDSSQSYKIFCITTILGLKALENNPDIDKVYTVDKDWDNNYNNKRWLRNYKNIYALVKKINPEIAISCRSTAYHLETIAIFNSLVKTRIGFSSKGLKSLLTNTIPYNSDSHRVNQNINLMMKFTKDVEDNIPTKPYFYPDIKNINKTKFDTLFKSGKKIVLINTFAEHDYIWDLDFYKEILEFLISKKYNIYFVGLEKDKQRINLFIRKEQYQNTFNLLGHTTIDELSYILNKSDLLVTVDTGIRHLANCFDLPIISFRKTPNLDSEFGKYTKSEYIFNEKLGREKYANTLNFVDVIKPGMICKEVEK